MKIFISYRRDDTQPSSGRLYDSLSQHFTKDVLFKDVDNIPLGRDFRVEIANAISESFAMVLVIGPEFLAKRSGESRLNAENDPVRIEIEQAIAAGLAIFPVLVDRAEMPSSKELPEPIRDTAFLHALRLDHDRWSRDIEPLVGALETERERVAAEKAERERVAAEKAERERVAAEKAERERVAAEKAERERVAAEKAERKRVDESRREQTAQAPVEAQESNGVLEFLWLPLFIAGVVALLFVLSLLLSYLGIPSSPATDLIDRLRS